MNFFSNLFKPLDCNPSPTLFQVNSPKVSVFDNSLLISSPSSEEIKAVVFSFKQNSSPGPDGFNGAFFTVTWNIIGQIVSLAIQHFFHSRRLHKASNTFFLAAIPKSKSRHLSRFQIISLLNVTYKILTKILVTRLSKILPSLISSHQAAFIKGRNIQHHSGLAFELYQKLNSKINKGSICLKLDISKAFDKLNWSFLFSALQFFNFSDAWISLIKECVCTTKCSVLLNRVPQGFFGSSCGLNRETLYHLIFSSQLKKSLASSSTTFKPKVSFSPSLLSPPLPAISFMQMTSLSS